MSAPAVAYLVLTALLTGVVIESNAKKGNAVMIAFHVCLVAVELGLLYLGGFFVKVSA